MQPQQHGVHLKRLGMHGRVGGGVAHRRGMGLRGHGAHVRAAHGVL